jgi:hypothetical protein
MDTGALEVAAGTPDANILDARVRHLGEYWGIAIFGPDATVADSDVRTAQGQALDTELNANATVLRTRLETEGGHLATIRSPEVVIDSSLLTGGSIGVEVYAGFAPPHSVTLSNDTIDVGKPKVADNSGVAVKARADAPGVVSATLVNSVTVEEQEVDGGGTASVTCNTSVIPIQVESAPAGPIECGTGNGNVFASPAALFVPGPDWHLLPGSAGVESGTGGDALTATDLDGNARIADGNGDGILAIDRGAYELPPPVPMAGAGPSNAFKFGKLKRNKRKGTAKLGVEIPGPGRLVLSGKKVKKSSVDAKRAGSFSLSIAPKGKLAKTLRSKGSAKTSIKVAFTPTGGTTNARIKSVKLIRKR